MPRKDWDIEMSQYGLAGEFISFAEQRFSEERQKLCCSPAMPPFCLSLHGKGFRPVPQYFLCRRWEPSLTASKSFCFASCPVPLSSSPRWQYKYKSRREHKSAKIHFYFLTQSYHLQGIVWYEDCCNMLGLAGMALIFLTAAQMVLCFGLVDEPMLITHQYLGKCSAVFVQH